MTNIIGYSDLKSAIARNPSLVVEEVGKFLSRGIAVYNRGIMRSPWTIGSNGGGAPVSTRNLIDKHYKVIDKWQAKIYTDVPYAKYVHDGTKYMQARPWLDYVKDTSDKEIQALEQQLLDNIVADLAK